MFVSVPQSRVPVPNPPVIEFGPYTFASVNFGELCQQLNYFTTQWDHLREQQQQRYGMAPATGFRRLKPKPKKQASKDKSQHRQQRRGPEVTAAGSSSNPNPGSLGFDDSSPFPTAPSRPEQTNGFVWTPTPQQQQQQQQQLQQPQYQYQNYSASSSGVSLPTVGLAHYDSFGTAVYVGDQTQTFVRRSAQSSTDALVSTSTEIDYAVLDAAMNQTCPVGAQQANSLGTHSLGFPPQASQPPPIDSLPQMPYEMPYGDQMISGDSSGDFDLQTPDLTDGSGNAFASYSGSFGSFSSTCANFKAMDLNEPGYVHHPQYHQQSPWQISSSSTALLGSNGGLVSVAPPPAVLSSQRQPTGYLPLYQASGSGSSVPRSMSAGTSGLSLNNLTVSPKQLKNHPSPTPTPTPASSTDSFNAAFFREQRNLPPLIVPMNQERTGEPVSASASVSTSASAPATASSSVLPTGEARKRLPDKPHQRHRSILMKPLQRVFPSSDANEVQGTPKPQKSAKTRAASPLPSADRSSKRRLSRVEPPRRLSLLAPPPSPPVPTQKTPPLEAVSSPQKSKLARVDKSPKQSSSTASMSVPVVPNTSVMLSTKATKTKTETMPEAGAEDKRDARRVATNPEAKTKGQSSTQAKGDKNSTKTTANAEKMQDSPKVNVANTKGESKTQAKGEGKSSTKTGVSAEKTHMNPKADTVTSPDTKVAKTRTKSSTSTKPSTSTISSTSTPKLKPTSKSTTSTSPIERDRSTPTGSDTGTDSDYHPSGPSRTQTNTNPSHPPIHIQPTPQGNHFPNRRAADRFLIDNRRAGLTYKEIRLLGNYTEAESTLRGRYRTLTKPPHKRVRDPQWTDRDLALLERGVRKFARLASRPAHGERGLKISWKEVAQYIVDSGGSYHFGNSTCRKKWDEVLRGRAQSMDVDDVDEDMEGDEESEDFEEEVEQE